MPWCRAPSGCAAARAGSCWSATSVSNLNRADMYAKELDFFISCSYGPGRYDSTYEEERRRLSAGLRALDGKPQHGGIPPADRAGPRAGEAAHLRDVSPSIRQTRPMPRCRPRTGRCWCCCRTAASKQAGVGHVDDGAEPEAAGCAAGRGAVRADWRRRIRQRHAPAEPAGAPEPVPPARRRQPLGPQCVGDGAPVGCDLLRHRLPARC